MSIYLSRPGFLPPRLAAETTDREPLSARFHRLARLNIPRGYDDRLLRDIGLERQDVAGEEGLFWETWLGTKAPWRL